MPEQPRFSLITPVYETPADVLWAMLESVRTQTFEDWELCLVDDCSPDPEVMESLQRVQAEDPRVRVQRRQQNGGIVAASNDALAMADGEFVVLLDHDDELHPDALAHVHEALEAEPEGDYVYTDEDKIDRAGHHSGPFFKPDWSPERMRTQMYTCHLSVFRRSLVEAVGGFHAEYEGAQDWDLVLRVTERARKVLHVPRILYHWRMLETSTAMGEEAKPWAYTAAERAVQEHCERIGLQARVELDKTDFGVYHLHPALVEEPTVSIVIPTAGQRREVRYEQIVLVTNCVRSIVERSSYENYEIVVVADSDTDPAVLGELREIAGKRRLRVVDYDRPFSFSAKINAGAVRAEGEHLLLLNDDTEVYTDDWIERMVMYSGLEQVGAVGGRLVLEDGRLQHVGIRFEGGLPGHPFHGYGGAYRSYANSVRVAQNCLAVTGACLMTRRELFEQVGGLSTTLPVNYNDVDFCLKLRKLGKRTVYDPDQMMYHFESSSRSTEVEDWEKALLRQRWAADTVVDPYSNPNLRHETPRLTSPFVWALRRRPRLRRRQPKGQPV